MATRKLSPEDEFHYGWHGVPDPEKRASMSPEDLAIELSKIEKKDSPPYILLSHELSLRIAKEQTKATLSAGRFGGFATIIAVFITAFLGSFAGGASKPAEQKSVVSCPSTTCNCSYPVTAFIPAINKKPAPKNPDGKPNPKP